MNVLIIDQECLGLDFALRCMAAGHSVRWYRWTKKPIKDGQGFKGLEIIDDWRGSMQWAKAGLIFLTGNCKFLPELERFRDFGFPVFGPSVASADLEIKRSSGMELMRKVGIDIPTYKEFDSLQSAAKFARSSDKTYVFKPMGDEDDKSLTYVASDPADLVGWLERRIRAGTKMKGKCMLQEKIDMLVELGVSGWFGPEGFLPGKWQLCFENKKLMPGDIGPSTGEQGTVCQYNEADKLAEEMLVPITDRLKKLGHRGDFAIGCGIDKKGKAWPFEYTARAGWPAFFIQTASHEGDPAQWMVDLLKGKDTLKVSSDVAIGVVCAQPNYPYNKSPPELVEGNPISGEITDNIHLCAVMMGSGPTMKAGKIVDEKIHQTTGEYVLVATGLGSTVKESHTAVYKTVDGVKFKDMMYRDDIGNKLEGCLPELHKLGYCENMKFSSKGEKK